MFEQALRSAVQTLHAAREQGRLDEFALIGGLAVSRWAVSRATADIDFAVSLAHAPVGGLAEFLGGSLRIGDAGDPLLSSITFSAVPEAISVQLVQFPLAWERVVFHELQIETIAECLLPIIDWKGLVLIKLYAGGPLDLDDARKIIEVNPPSRAEREYLQKKAAALRVSRRLRRILG